jgi:hypothetical protein
MLESEGRLRSDVADILESLLSLGGGAYAAVFDGSRVLVERPEGEAAPPLLRTLIAGEALALLRLPGALQRGEELSDLFAGFESSEFLLGVVNGKAGLLVDCADAQQLLQRAERLLAALVDRLLRLEPRYRYDEKGRGILFGSPRLETVVIPRADTAPALE